MPPKNITSVARKTHIPSQEAWCCCSRSSNCSWTAPASDAGALTEFINFFGLLFVGVGRVRHARRRVEVVRRRRRRRLPFEPPRLPWVGARDRAVAERPEEINERQHVADGEDRRARRRQDVQHLELRRGDVGAARDAEIAENELREERQ